MNYSHLQDLKKQIKQENLNVAYINDPLDIEYFSGFKSDWEDKPLALLIFPHQDPILVVPDLEVSKVENSKWPYYVYGYNNYPNIYQVINNLINTPDKKFKTWGIETNKLTVQELRDLKKFFSHDKFEFNLTNLIEQLQIIKTPEEIEKLKQAGRDADFAMKVAMNSIKEGKSELEITAELEYQLKKHGIEKMSFNTLVQAGKRAIIPHNPPTLNKLRNCDLVVLDLGTVHDGYVSDITRTVAIGKLTKKQQELYQIVLAAQEKAQKVVKPGMTAGELDKVARDVIEKAGYGKYFIHTLGHGIGRKIHEHPFIRKNNSTVLKEGMTFSIEPGIYIPNVGGIRIEDSVYLTKDGAKSLTATTKKLQYF